ncbi:MAG: glycosyltransferase [Formivibrio sp.]|nr:glycosyltransferase [Formivibrio sp.]
MKIVFFVRDLGLGGVERCVTLVAAGLAARGFDVTIAMLGGKRNLWTAQTDSVRVVDLSSRWHGKKPWTWLAGWRAARALAREADVAIAATFLMPLYMAWAATLGLKKRLIGWVHGPMQELDNFARMNPIHRAACRFIYRRLPEILCVSDHTRQSFARWLGLPVQAGWQVMPNFVEALSADSAPAASREPQAPLQLLFVGRIAEEKQPHLWLDTLEALAARSLAAELTILGEGPLQDWVKSEALRRQLTVHFHGQIGGVSEFMRRADWLLLTSRFEGFGLVVLEAMQVGLPVVSTDSGGVNDFFQNRVNEFVVQEATGAALAAKIAAQLPQHAEIGKWLKNRAQDYALEVLLGKWVALLKKGH